LGGDGRYAFVCFRMTSWRELSEFVFEKLMPAISDDFDGLEARVHIDAHSRDDALAWIDVNPVAMARLANHIRETLVDLGQAPVTAYEMTMQLSKVCRPSAFAILRRTRQPSTEFLPQRPLWASR
jgi:hypothetical protein